MAGLSAENAVPVEVAGEERVAKKRRGLSENLGIKDEYAGERIKDAADRTCAITAITALVVGFLIWNRLQDTISLLIGILVAGMGLFAAFVIMSVMYSYGDLITMSIEQTRILKKLEARNTAGVVAAFTAAPGKDPVAEKSSDAAADGNDGEDGPKDGVMTADSGEARETPENKAPAAGSAVYVDRTNRIAQFSERLKAGVICPICGRQQFPSADACFFCGCVFLYEQDPPAQGEKDQPVRQPS